MLTYRFIEMISLARASAEGFFRTCLALTNIQRQLGGGTLVNPSACRSARLRPALPFRRAPPRPDPPVVSPGFGFDRLKLFFSMLWGARTTVPYCALLFYVLVDFACFCFSSLSCTMLCFTMLCYACNSLLCYVCCAVLCYTMLCYVILFLDMLCRARECRLRRLSVLCLRVEDMGLLRYNMFFFSLNVLCLNTKLMKLFTNEHCL